MLANAPVAPTVPVVDLARAGRFYEDILGLRLQRRAENEAWYECGNGTMLLLYQREPTKADHTVAGFVVDDVEQTVGELRKKGVRFEDYDLPGIKTVNGIATMDTEKAAWFKDTEGNILAVAQIVK